MSKKEKAPKVKKDKATKQAEKAEKKLERKAQRIEDKKNPEIKAANRAHIIKCIAAVLCAVIFFFNVSAAFKTLAEMVKETAYSVSSGSAESDGGSSLEDSLAGSLADQEESVDAESSEGTTDAPSADGDAQAPAGDGSTDAPADDKGGAAADTKKKPADGVETLNYFNTAINKVKTSAKSVEQKSVTNYLAASPTVPSVLNAVYKTLGGDSWLDETLQKESQGAATYTGADIKAKFPVEGESYASKLTASDVKSATCTESNGIYTITITTVADGKSDAHKHGAGHNPKAHNVILPGTINENIPGIAKSITGNAAMNYPSSTITVTVDAATGNVLTANYDLKWTINFDKAGAIIPLGTKSVYEIKW